MALDVSPDGRIVAIARHRDRNVHIWKIKKDKMTNSWYIQLIQKSINTNTSFFEVPCDSEICSLRFSAQHLAVGLSNGTLRIFDPQQNRMMKRVIAHNGPILSIVFTPDGEGLISGSRDATIKYWKVGSLIPRSARRNGKGTERRIEMVDMFSKEHRVIEGLTLWGYHSADFHHRML